MTTPDPAMPRRRSAPIVEHDSREPRDRPDWSVAASTKWRDRVRRALGTGVGPLPPGQLWQRLAEFDVERHGRPITVGRPREYVSPFAAWHFLANLIERRRPAMRAARAELDALNAPLRWTLGPGAASAPPPAVPMILRRLEPEPSAMARTGLAVGLAFTSDDATA